MAVEVVMPKQGNSVESCIIIDWKVKEGDSVSVGDVVCEAETDKSTIEVESTADGTVLKLLYAVEDEVPVMQPIMVVGKKGEKVSVETSTQSAESEKTQEPQKEEEQVVKTGEGDARRENAKTAEKAMGISPRARAVASSSGVDMSLLQPTGPKGRIIERDVIEVLAGKEPLTPAAKAALLKQGLSAPVSGSGIGGRVLSSDLVDSGTTSGSVVPAAMDHVGEFPGPFEEMTVRGVRKVTAKRMHESLATTAQFTMNAFADASSLQSLRARLKSSAPELGLQKVTINDLILFAVSRTIGQFGYMNSHFLGDKMLTFKHVHLGCAVDTPKGLLVPVVKYADKLSLKQLSDEFKRLATESMEGKAQPDDLSGGTFTVTNLGSMGVESFTPVINVPEVAILGVGGISLRAKEDSDGDVFFVPHIGLSLTIDHQAVDGAPAARFLKALCENIASIDLLMAL